MAISNYCSQLGDACNNIGEYKLGSEAFETAFRAEMCAFRLPVSSVPHIAQQFPGLHLVPFLKIPGITVQMGIVKICPARASDPDAPSPHLQPSNPLHNPIAHTDNRIIYWTWCIVLLGAEITVTLGEYRKLKQAAEQEEEDEP